MIEFPCWSCGKLLKAKPEYSGRKCKCTKCSQSNSIPGAKQAQIQEEMPAEPVGLHQINVGNFRLHPVMRATPDKMPPIDWTRLLPSLAIFCCVAAAVYYLFFFDTTVPMYWGVDSPWVPRVYKAELGNEKLVGIIASGFGALVFSVLLSIRLKQ